MELSMIRVRCACGSRYCTDSIPRANDGSASNRRAIRQINKQVRRRRRREGRRSVSQEFRDLQDA